MDDGQMWEAGDNQKEPETYRQRVFKTRLSLTIRPTNAPSPPGVIISTAAPMHTWMTIQTL